MFRKIKFFLFFLLLLIIGLSLYFTTTPYYTLVRTFWAMKNQDVEEFQYYCDADSLSESLIDEFLYLPSKELPQNLVITLKMMQSDTSKVNFFRKLLAKSVKNQILKGIKENQLYRNDSEKFQMSNFFSFQNVLNEENLTIIKLDIPKNHENIPLYFRLRKIKNQWKLVGFEKLGVFLLKSIKSQHDKR